jgi:hypothetical protein
MERCTCWDMALEGILIRCLDDPAVITLMLHETQTDMCQISQKRLNVRNFSASPKTSIAVLSAAAFTWEAFR